MEQPHDAPSYPKHHIHTHIASMSDADPILADNKDVLFAVSTAMVPVAIYLTIFLLLPPRVNVIVNNTIPARSGDMKYPPPPPMNGYIRQ